MRSDITGVEFKDLSDVNINFDGYRVGIESVESNDDPETIWYVIPVIE